MRMQNLTLRNILPPIFMGRIAKKACAIAVLAMFCLVSSSENSYALFENLTKSGSEIFEGMKGIIYAVTGFGIIGIAAGSFFGNGLNWKWLSAIIIGLIVIAGTAGVLQYIGGSDATSSIAIQDTLINAG